MGLLIVIVCNPLILLVSFLMVTFRLALATDAKEIVEIYRPYVEETAITFETRVPTVGEIEARIQGASAQFPWLVAENSGHVLGYAYAAQFRDRGAFAWSV